METDDRNILETLKSELDFLEKGGYGRSVRTPREPTVVFQDSPICPEFPCRAHTNACLLMQFVPADHRDSPIPCHHIPLNEAGETISGLDAESRERTQEAVTAWLRRTIRSLEPASSDTTAR